MASAYPYRVSLYFSQIAAGSGLNVEKQLTFAEFEREVSLLAGAFYARGIRKGDRVVVMAPMSYKLYIVILAIMKLAATAVLIEPFMGLAQMITYCRISEPKALITTPKGHLLRLFSKTFRDVPLKFTISTSAVPGAETIDTLYKAGGPVVDTVRPDDEAPALINFTSGNKGRPRAVDRSHDHLWAQHLALLKAFPFKTGDVDMSAFPIFPLHNMASGIPTVLPAMFSGLPAKVEPKAVVRQIQTHQVSTIKGSPAFFRAIVEYCAKQSITLKTVRAILTGGAPVHPQLIEAFNYVIPNGETYVAYGSTEAEPISGISGTEILNETANMTMQGRGICVGRPISDTKVRIIKCLNRPIDLGNDDWDSIGQPDGVAGEIVVTGPHVNKSYFRDPQAVAQTKFRDDINRIWHRTDDMGYFDESGRLWLVGRLPNRIIRNGKEVHPFQIEPMINGLSFVDRSALIGITDASRGQKAVLIVAPRLKGFIKRLRKSKDWANRIREVCKHQGLPVDEIHFKRSIPLDRRRHAKIDYRKINNWYRKPPLLRLIT